MKRITFHIDDETRTYIDDLAVEKDRPVAWVLRELIMKGIETHKEETKS